MAVEFKFTCDRCKTEAPGRATPHEGMDRLPEGWGRHADPRPGRPPAEGGYKVAIMGSVYANQRSPESMLDLCAGCYEAVRAMAGEAEQVWMNFIDSAWRNLDWRPTRPMTDRDLREQQRRRIGDSF